MVLLRATLGRAAVMRLWDNHSCRRCRRACRPVPAVCVNAPPLAIGRRALFPVAGRNRLRLTGSRRWTCAALRFMPRHGPRAVAALSETQTGVCVGPSPTTRTSFSRRSSKRSARKAWWSVKDHARRHDRKSRPQVDRHRHDPDGDRGEVRRLYPDGRLLPGGQDRSGSGRCADRAHPEREELNGVCAAGRHHGHGRGFGAGLGWLPAVESSPRRAQPDPAWNSPETIPVASGSALRCRISIPPPTSRRATLMYCDPFAQYAIVAADEAVREAGLTRETVGGAIARYPGHRHRRRPHDRRRPVQSLRQGPEA